MAQENVDVVRAVYEAFARGDTRRLLLQLDPAIRVYDRPVHPEASVYEGREGFLRFADTDWETFEAVRYQPQDFLVRGKYVVVPIKQAGRGKYVVVPIKQAGRGKGSSLDVEEDIVNVWRLREGKCVELRIYSTIGEALEAVGLSE